MKFKIEETKKQRAKLKEKIKLLMIAQRFNDALLLASGQCQFIRECIEQMEG